MQTKLDFSLVPLDKWISVFESCSDLEGLMPHSLVKALNDVQGFATVHVKDENDLNKEIADSYEEWSNSTDKQKSSAAFNRMNDAVAEKRRMLSSAPIAPFIPF